jgi:hypothetical protein
MTTLRQQAMADVIAKQDPVRGLQLRQEATRAEREAKEYPLRYQALEQQTALGKTQLSAAQRKEQEDANYSNFQTAFAQSDGSIDSARKLATEFKLTQPQLLSATSAVTGIKENELKAMDQYTTEKLKNKTLDQVLDIYKNDPKFDDKTHVVKSVDPRTGKVTLTTVETLEGGKDGRKLGSITLDNEALALGYLHQQAKDPANLATWTLGTQKAVAQIGLIGAQTESATAGAGEHRARASLYMHRATLDKEEAKRLSPEAVGKLNELSQAISDAEEKGDAKGAARAYSAWQRQYVNSMSGLGKVVQPKAPGQVREMTDVDKENLKHYRAWAADRKNAKLSQGQKDKYAEELGISQYLKRGKGQTTGLGANLYATDTDEE